MDTLPQPPIKFTKNGFIFEIHYDKINVHNDNYLYFKTKLNTNDIKLLELMHDNKVRYEMDTSNTSHWLKIKFIFTDVIEHTMEITFICSGKSQKSILIEKLAGINYAISCLNTQLDTLKTQQQVMKELDALV